MHVPPPRSGVARLVLNQFWIAAGPPQDTRQAECVVTGGGEVVAPATFKKNFKRLILILKLSVLLLVVGR
ncbi:hypothetical protein PC116_g26417 [Phytophthora cactorum]|uniref:Uncharacterized protein n=1 Tax=Phytophthora cactorum TaxID=29920 RepID=A0A8T1AYJ7_9STRA|nr:hypothetical protein PC117_g24478 [Phytophthora cactorum]KAG4225144.1 hypothetical protein PC116_g26417 [Phytophthora cactorum]